MQFIDLKKQYEVLQEKINKNIHNVLTHGQYIMGKEVQEFELQLSEYLDVKHAITCANGTDALQMIFMAYGIGHGDAVFTSNITFIASVEPACMLGATPVFCDIDKDTYNICPINLEKQIIKVLNKDMHVPKAVVAVDFLGNPADYDELKKICKKYDLILIEDAAQSFGAEYKGKKCCTFGDVATTSFFPAKPLGCYGDGGAIFTNNDELADILKSIRVHGKGSSKYDNVRVGVNSRLDTIQAAILKVKLDALKEYEVEARQEVVRRYNEAFKHHFTVPFIAENNKSVYAQYALLAKSTEERNTILDKLTKSNIPNMVYYPKPQNELDVFKNYEYNDEEYLVSKHYCAHTFSLPMHPYLSNEDQAIIIDAVLEAIK